MAGTGNIFVSYRRDDSKHAAGRLVDRLVDSFPRERLFLDVDSIDIGLDFVEVLTEKVAQCDVMLVLIGKRWLDITDEDGARRLDNPHDFVHIEIKAALDRDIRVIPILIDGAEPMSEADLPAPIASLARRQVIRVDHESFGRDATQLTEALERILAPLVAPKAPVSPVAPPVAVTPPPADKDAHNPNDLRPGARAFVLDWCTALSPLLFGALEFASIVLFSLKRTQFEWFGWDAMVSVTALPFALALATWAMRAFIAPDMRKLAKQIGGAMLGMNALVVLYWYLVS